MFPSLQYIIAVNWVFFSPLDITSHQIPQHFVMHCHLLDTPLHQRNHSFDLLINLHDILMILIGRRIYQQLFD